MAWEYNPLYDYSAIIEVKRDWVRNAFLMHRIYGTLEAIAQNLKRMFGEVTVEEWWSTTRHPTISGSGHRTLTA